MSKKDKGSNPLNKQIGGSKGKYPDKEVINFIKNESNKSDGKALVIFTLFMACLLVFIYFGVIKQLDRIDEAEKQYKQVQAELQEYKDKNDELSYIEDEYNSRVEMYYTDDESQYSNRKEIIDMLNEDILPYMDDISVYVSEENEISITANQADFATVASVLKILQDDDRIYYVKLEISDQTGDATIGATKVDAQYVITWNTDGNEVNEDA